MAPQLTLQQDFQDEHLNGTDIDWEDAKTALHRIHRKGAVVYWRDCDKVTLMRNDGGLKFVKEIERTQIGKGKLDAGLALIFYRKSGKAKD